MGHVLSDWSENSEHGALYIRTEGSDSYAMYMECNPKGWWIGIWDKRQKVTRKFGNRFETISNAEGNAIGFRDTENIFSFDGLVLLDLPSKDRIQTALTFKVISKGYEFLEKNDTVSRCIKEQTDVDFSKYILGQYISFTLSNKIYRYKIKDLPWAYCSCEKPY